MDGHWKAQAAALLAYLLSDKDDEDERHMPETEIDKGGIPVIKAANDEEQVATYVAYEPNVPDLHGEWMSEDTVRKACYSFNQHCMKANLFHRVMTDKIDVLESYIIPIDVYIGERLVRKGTWLMTLKYKDSGLWEMQKSGEIQGISIGARGRKKEPK